MVVVLVSQEYAYSQDAAGQVEMADSMRSEGKIYIVVLVISIVFTGLLLYLINTDRKISRLEKEVDDLQPGNKK